ncbi:lectin [Corallococcus macrosporus]|uniref:Lectin n=1 Tax=Corallococcus macrosporus TaxID=35 RepID=A0ABS3DMV6_9BACT|nr:lectin [Corallococcus macrosporus]MBN8232625.1 lectin [Corallococcus macrosporus]
MDANQGLGFGQRLYSCDGRFWLVMQSDGNLVLRQGATALWHSRTNGTAAVGAVMQGDGNFVIYTAEPRALWHSHTYGYSGAYLTVQNDGNVVIRTSRGGALWNTQTGGH